MHKGTLIPDLAELPCSRAMAISPGWCIPHFLRQSLHECSCGVHVILLFCQCLFVNLLIYYVLWKAHEQLKLEINSFSSIYLLHKWHWVILFYIKNLSYQTWTSGLHNSSTGPLSTAKTKLRGAVTAFLRNLFSGTSKSHLASYLCLVQSRTVKILKVIAYSCMVRCKS